MMLKCWEMGAKSRPRFTEIVAELSGLTSFDDHVIAGTSDDNYVTDDLKSTPNDDYVN